ncbi:chromosome condensation protein CrcB, partial [Cutibacterium avidum]
TYLLTSVAAGAFLAWAMITTVRAAVRRRSS